MGDLVPKVSQTVQQRAIDRIGIRGGLLSGRQISHLARVAERTAEGNTEDSKQAQTSNYMEVLPNFEGSQRMRGGPRHRLEPAALSRIVSSRAHLGDYAFNDAFNASNSSRALLPPEINRVYEDFIITASCQDLDRIHGGYAAALWPTEIKQ